MPRPPRADEADGLYHALNRGGWLNYHAVPDNMRRLYQFVDEVSKLWLRQLRRRIQRGRASWPWSRMNRVLSKYIPKPKILYPHPTDRLRIRLAARAE